MARSVRSKAKTVTKKPSRKKQHRVRADKVVERTAPPEVYANIAKYLPTDSAMMLSMVEKSSNTGAQEQLLDEQRLDKDAYMALRQLELAKQAHKNAELEHIRAESNFRGHGWGMPQYTPRERAAWTKRLEDLRRKREDAMNHMTSARFNVRRYDQNLPYYKQQLRKGHQNSLRRNGRPRYEPNAWDVGESEIALRDWQEQANRRQSILDSGASEDQFYADYMQKRLDYDHAILEEAESREKTPMVPLDPLYRYPRLRPYNFYNMPPDIVFRTDKAVGYTGYKWTPEFMKIAQMNDLSRQFGRLDLNG